MGIEGIHGWCKQDPRKYKVVVQPGRRHADEDHPKGETQQANLHHAFVPLQQNSWTGEVLKFSQISEKVL